MKVELMIVGWNSAPAAVYPRGGDRGARIGFPTPAYLIETETERILVDSGLHPASIGDPGAFYGRPEAGLFELEQEHAITELVDVETLTRIVITHLHFDHVGALTLLPASIPIVIQRREWEAAGDARAIRRHFLYPRDYSGEERKLVLVDGDHDLLGDGSIELLLTPGHTPGHQSLRLAEELIIGAGVGHFAATLHDL